MRGKHKRPLKGDKVATEKTNFFGKPSVSKKNFFSDKVQTKLKMSEANDASELQADAVADAVTSGSNTAVTVQKKGGEEEASKKAEPIQKQEEEQASARFEVNKSEDEEAQSKQEMLHRQEEEKPAAKFEIQREEKEVQAKPQFHRKEDKATKTPFEYRMRSAKSGGFPLPDSFIEEMEQKMKRNFKRVRIHTDEKAVKLCEEISAQAFTSGFHIFFNTGKYQPESASGKHLLIHELTHVVQQKF